jgi:Subtilase family
MRSSAVRAGLGVTAAIATGLVFGSLPAAALTAAVPAGPGQAVIVVLADQYQNLPAGHTSLGARNSAVAGAQAPLINGLHAAGAQNVRSLSLLNALTATVTPDEAATLRSNPQVAAVVPDAAIKLPQQALPTTVGPTAKHGKAQTLPAGVCAPNGKVQLNPEAISAINADSDVPGAPTARSLGATGAGVVVGDIAGSVDPATPELVRADGTGVIGDYQDFTGEGGSVQSEDLESYLDDGMIAAQGDHVYNLQDYMSATDPLAQPCDIRLEGVSPDVTLDAYKVYGADDYTTTSAFLEAINYAVTVDHVNVLNEEGGSFPMPDTSADLIKLANTAAIAAGVTITSPSYDAGPENTIWSPSSEPGVLSVGASTTFRSYAQSDTAGYDSIGATGYVSGNISSLSSGGSTEVGRSIDLVAPGDLDWAICTADPTLAADCTNQAGAPSGLTQSGGTSEAGPLVAGVAALVIQAYRTTHGGASPTPQLVGQLLTSTADDLGAIGAEQGAGQVDAYRAVEAAMSVHTADGSPTATGNTLLTDVDQLDAIGNPGASQNFSVQVTNTGTSTQKVSLSGRTLGASHVVSNKTVTLADGGASYVDAYGFTRNVQKVAFTVPAGQSELDANIAYPGTAQDPVDLTLLDPHGLLTGYSLPQGNGNHGHIDVHTPVSGTWTAVITDTAKASNGYVGPVQFSAAVSTFTTLGSVSPATLTLAPGAVGTAHLSVPLPAAPGDLTGSLAISSPQSGASSIPITLRSVIPVANGVGTFTGDLVGGNGRGYVPAQTLFYNVNVPQGEPALDLQVALGHGATDPFTAFLVSPDEQNPARATNQLPSGATVVDGNGARAHVLNPEAGQWTVIVTFNNPVNGDALDTPVNGTVDFAPIAVKTAGVPTGGVLQPGTAQQVAVTVHNDSAGVESYFLDARLAQQAQLTLASFTPSANLTLPLSYSNADPQWLVPTETTALTASATSTAPVMFDAAPYNGEPDLASTAVGNNAFVSYSAAQVTQGDWNLIPQPTGAFGPTAGASASTVTLGLGVTTRAFDPNASSPSGDLWLRGVNPQAAFAPVVVQPGQSATLYLAITPSGPANSTVTGTIFLDDDSALSENGASPTGDELVAIPYHYTVG